MNMRRRCLPSWIIVCATAVTAVVVLGVLLGWTLGPKGLDAAPPLIFQGDRWVDMFMTLISEDALSNGGSFNVAFRVVGDSCAYVTNDTQDNCPDINIYMDR